MARFSFGVGEQLLALQQALRDETWRPGPYTHFTIREPKQRLISAAPFADRVVHHALCSVIEPRFEAAFIPWSYANRVGKGTHRAVDRVQALAQSHRWVLRLDVVKHFPSLDHAILRDLLWRRVPEPGLRRIIDLILASGAGIHTNAPDGPLLPGDDRAQLRDWRDRVIDFLAQRLRLRVHEGSAQVQACADGIPWLGFVVSPHRRRVKSRKVVEATRHLVRRHAAWRRGDLAFSAFDASVQGWINHVRYADTWGLRRHVLERLPWGGRPLRGCRPSSPSRAIRRNLTT